MLAENFLAAFKIKLVAAEMDTNADSQVTVLSADGQLDPKEKLMTTATNNLKNMWGSAVVATFLEIENFAHEDTSVDELVEVLTAWKHLAEPETTAIEVLNDAQGIIPKNGLNVKSMRGHFGVSSRSLTKPTSLC